MSDKMMKMMMNKKKQGKSLSDSEKKSKLEALMGMKGLADSHMGNKLKNLKKVTVASNSPEGLKAGLHKAEDLADQSDDSSSDDTAAGLEDSPDMMNKFSEGGNVYDKGDSGGHVAQMPKEFDTDIGENEKEMADMRGSGDTEPGYDAGTFDAENNDMSGESSDDESSEAPESVDQIVQDAQHLNPDELKELIQKLQEQVNSSQS